MTPWQSRPHGRVISAHRIAIASGRIEMLPATLALIEAGNAKKGDVLGIARIDGIMAAKKTSDLIPLCRPLALTRVAIEFEAASARQPGATGIFCAATVETVGPTGVEMEALTAVQVALLTIHDMCKAVDRGMSIHDVRVVEKHGGSRGVLWRTSTRPCGPLHSAYGTAKAHSGCQAISACRMWRNWSQK